MSRSFTRSWSAKPRRYCGRRSRRDGPQASSSPARHRPGARSARRIGRRRHYNADRLLQGATVMTFLLHTWLQALSRKSARGARTRRGATPNRPHRVVLRLEALEDRMVPSQNGYVQTNLVSDVPGLAQITDPALKNPWGTGHGTDGSFSLADEGTSVSTQYSVTAAGVVKVPLTITIPKTIFGPQGPTGQVTNDTSSFLVNGAPASLIFANLNGTISAWNSSMGTKAQVVPTPPGGHYSGLDIGSNASGDFLY